MNSNRYMESLPHDTLMCIFLWLDDVQRASICSVSPKWCIVSIATGIYLRPRLAKYYALPPRKYSPCKCMKCSKCSCNHMKVRSCWYCKYDKMTEEDMLLICQDYHLYVRMMLNASPYMIGSCIVGRRLATMRDGKIYN